MTRIPTVVIGAGHLGTIHARLANSLDRIDLLGIVDPSAAARDRVCSQVPVAGYGSLAELPRSPQAAIVAAPTALHHDLGQQLLSQGIHVLMEKPITVDSGQARELVETARRHEAVLQVGHVERFNPAFCLLTERVNRAKFIQTRRFSEYTFRSTDVGVVLDLMIHDLDLVLSLVDSPVAQVDAVGISVMGEHEDIAHARLEFENGTVANLEVSRCSFVRERSVQVFADNGYVQADLTSRLVKSVAPQGDMLSRAVDFLGQTQEQRNQVQR
ncbi:MAG: Gfo/Idh/MocA family oxidoreductase [Pirellulaceae bacterium]